MEIATKYKIVAGISVLALFVLLGIILYMQYSLSQKQQEIERSIIEFKKLEDGIVRLETKYVRNSDDLEKILKNLGVSVDIIKKDLDSQGAQLEAVAVIVGTTHGYSGTNLPSDFQKPSTGSSNNNDNIGNSSNPSNNNSNSTNPSCMSSYGYCQNAQGLNLFEQGEKEQIPFGSVLFDAASDKPWSVEVFPRKYYSILSMGKDNDGRTVAHSRMMIESQGKKHVVGINQAYYREVYEPARFYWWNPRLAGGIGFGLSTNGRMSSMVSAQFYPSSYASNKARPSWMFFGVGAGYDLVDDSFVGTVAPVMYNVLPKSNLIQNIYVGPTVGMGTDGGVRVNGSMNIAF
ncbi:MAG TPA: hypothetical protein VMX17_11995 [Candidatus Glassbacteria bacterium]|nr:hypothetical protein [Candidatus Glassbacteria bacterium]